MTSVTHYSGVKEKLINRAFEHYKADANIQQVYITDSVDQFAEFMADAGHPSKILDLTDVWGELKDAVSMPPLSDEHSLEIEIVRKLAADHDYRRDFGKQIADKLVAYLDLSTT